LYDDCTMAVNSYDCDYNKPYSPESLEHGNEMDTSTYTPSPVQHYTSAVATSSNTPGMQLDDKTDHKLSSSSIIIDMDDGDDDNSSHSDSPSFKASLQTAEIEGNERVMEEEIEIDDEGLEEIIANVLIEQLTGGSGSESEVRRRPYSSIGPDCDELRNMLAIAVRQEKQARELRKKRSHMSGVGWLISKLFSINTPAESGKKERVVLDRYGRKVETSRKEN
ncbi:unnamed protein product, partial [Acanthocheilonema viteae]